MERQLYRHLQGDISVFHGLYVHEYVRPKVHLLRGISSIRMIRVRTSVWPTSAKSTLVGTVDENSSTTPRAIEKHSRRSASCGGERHELSEGFLGERSVGHIPYRGNKHEIR